MTNDLSDTNPEEAVSCFALSKNDSYVMSASGGKISLFNMMTFKVKSFILEASFAHACSCLVSLFSLVLLSLLYQLVYSWRRFYNGCSKDGHVYGIPSYMFKYFNISSNQLPRWVSHYRREPFTGYICSAHLSNGLN